MVDEARLVATFLDLVRIDSPSGEEEAIGRRVMDLLCGLGATVERDGLGNVLARLDGRGEPLLLNAHLDTVAPGRGIEPVVNDGVIMSGGRTILGADDKAGVAIILEAVRVARESGLAHPPLDILFTVREELAVRGARAFDVRRLRARTGIGLDGGGAPGTVVTSAPAKDTLEITVHGRAAHAGKEPERGVSAITVAAEALLRMPLGRIDDETTANIGTVAGGLATNIVCDRVEMSAEVRSRNGARLAAQVEAMRRALAEAAARHGATVDLAVTHEYQAYTLSPDEPIVRLLGAGASRVGLVPRFIASGGGTDANVLNAAGLRVANISTGAAANHTPREHIAVADMVQCAAWLLACLGLAAADRTGPSANSRRSPVHGPANPLRSAAAPSTRNPSTGTVSSRGNPSSSNLLLMWCAYTSTTPFACSRAYTWPFNQLCLCRCGCL